MSLKCKIGLHQWDGCKCSECGILKDKGHNWNGCKCSICGKTRDEQHDHSKDCEKCAICGKTHESRHDWSKDCGKCSICGTHRSDAHKWEKDKCTVCCIDVGEIFEKGCENLNQNKIDEALNNFLTVINHNPNHANSLLLMSVLYFYKDQDEKSDEFYSKAISLNPDSPLAWTKLGNVYVQKKRPNKGLSFFVTALNFNLDFSMAWNHIAIELREKGLLEKSIKCSVKAVNLEPSNSLYWYNLGVLLHENNDQRTAIIAWGQASKLGNTQAQEELETLISTIKIDALDNIEFVFSAINSYGNGIDLQEIIAEINEADEDKMVQKLISEMEKLAIKHNGKIISSSGQTHFSNIVQIMTQIGAIRHGSRQTLKDAYGRSYIFDLYTLPNGTKLEAGYEI